MNPLAGTRQTPQHYTQRFTGFIKKNQGFTLFRSLTGLALAVAVMGAGQAFAQKLDVEDLARMPDTTGVSMSPEGDFIVAIRADPRDPSKRIIASADVSKVDGTKPLNWVATPSGRMSFVSARALKQGKVSLRLQARPGPAASAVVARAVRPGPPRPTSTRPISRTRRSRTLDDPFKAGRSIGVSEETMRCLEIGTNPSIIDLPLDPENVIVQQLDENFVSRYSKVNLRTGQSTSLYKDVGELSIALIDPRDGEVLVKQKVQTRGNLNYDFETYILDKATGNFDLEAPLTVDANNRNQMDVLSYDEQTGKYFVVTDKFSDKAAIYLYDPRTDKFDEQPLFAHKDFNATNVVLGRSKDNFGKILASAMQVRK
ncbi:MAG: hypothetical protein R3C46_12075 [Hyphomonadaceae bacterium]